MIGVLAFSGTAAAAPTCVEAVLDDWFDNGRVNRLYDLPCYGEAIDAIPLDIRDYSDAEEVISRALQAATSGMLAPGGVDPTPGSDLLHGGASKATRSSGTNPAPAAVIDTSGASSIPIPLLVLGGLSLALLAAGGFGRISRRRGDNDDSEGDGHI